MSLFLALLSGLVGWLLYASILALFSALVAWAVLRWAERGQVIFNRVYLANLLWQLAGVALIASVAMHEGLTHPPYRALLISPMLRLTVLLDMLIGVLLMWRLVPRADAHRIRPGSACLAAAMVMAIGFGVATSFL